MTNSASQTGNGLPNCFHTDTHQHCLLCNCAPLLTVFHSQFPEQEETSNLSSILTKDVDLLPHSLAIINSIQCILASLPLLALLDGGSTTTFIHKQCLPPGATPKVIFNIQTKLLNSKNSYYQNAPAPYTLIHNLPLSSLANVTMILSLVTTSSEKSACLKAMTVVPCLLLM